MPVKKAKIDKSYSKAVKSAYVVSTKRGTRLVDLMEFSSGKVCCMTYMVADEKAWQWAMAVHDDINNGKLSIDQAIAYFKKGY